MSALDTRTDEFANGIFRLSTFVPEVSPQGFTFNQFLIRAEESLRFHTGPRGMFSSVSNSVPRIVPLDSLRWIAFVHRGSGECGAMNSFLAASPRATVLHGETGVLVSLNDQRAMRDLADLYEGWLPED